MAKATRPVKNVAAAYKSRSPFKLNRQSRTFLQAHLECGAAEEAYEAAGRRDHGKRWGKGLDLAISAETRALGDAARAKRAALETLAEDISTRLKAKVRPNLDDVLLLGMVGWHSPKAYHALCRLVPMVAGIDMRAAV
ncbi:MAG: hypothetical protein K2X43_06020 [Hyphomonadaceae bacterium]|nr:hypothetical protein [Hyphomonadaceae bacterium]